MQPLAKPVWDYIYKPSKHKHAICKKKKRISYPTSLNSQGAMIKHPLTTQKLSCDLVSGQVTECGVHQK